ncbi:unnamed protein product [Rhodiola kirilowii]
MSSSSSQNENQSSIGTYKRKFFKLFGAEIEIDESMRAYPSQGFQESKRFATEPTDEENALVSAEGSLVEEANRFLVFVRMMTGEKVGFLVGKSDTIKSIHERVEKAARIPVDEIRLIYGGKQLYVEKKVDDYDEIDQRSIIHVVAKLRSCSNVKMWRTLNDLVISAIRMCKCEQSAEINGLLIRGAMEYFLKKVKQSKIELNIRHLNLFTSMSVADALSMIYLSPVEENKKLGSLVIKRFISEVDYVPKTLRAYAAPLVLQFCLRLRTKDPVEVEPLYYDCRSTLCSLVDAIFSVESEPVVRGLVVWQDIFPFVIEMGDKLVDDLTTSLGSPSMATPKLKDVQDFSSLLSAVLNRISETVNSEDPIRMPDGALAHIFGKQLQSLRFLFIELLNKMDSCLFRVDSSGGGESTFNDVGAQYLLLLRALNGISKIYKGAGENIQAMLEMRKLLFRDLVFACAKQIEIKDNHWLSQHKEILGYDCRRYLATMVFENYSEDIDGSDHELFIERSNLLVQSFETITKEDPESLRDGFTIYFNNEVAAGLGVMREWFFLVFKEIFITLKALFITNPCDQRRFYINPASSVEPKHLEYFKFCGRMIALALMYDMQVGIVFDRVLFLQLAGLDVRLEDIKDTDTELYQSCKIILDMDENLVDSDTLGLTFVTEFEKLAKKVVELRPGGRYLKVNSSNRTQYINDLIRCRFLVSTREQLARLSEGFQDIMSGPDNVSFFFRSINLEDLDQMLGGSDNLISIDDWKSHTDYNGYQRTDRQIIWFWKIIEEMSPEHRRQLLFFWTSIKYLPIEGFSGLPHRLGIHKVGVTTDHLPTSHTCFFQIYLPKYPTYEMMQQRIVIVIQEHVGSSFGYL